MFITLDILQKRGACQEYLNFFAKHYPDGVEMLELIEKGHVPEHGLHWGYQWLDPNEEEAAAYWKRVHVTDSEGVHESSHVHNSHLVSKSSHVSDSEAVYNSKNVNKSMYISDSEFVEDSRQVGISSFVENGDRVIKGKNISDSTEVYDSEYIVQSSSVFKSYNVVNGHGIWNSKDITDCGFCANCSNLTNSLFCQGITEGNNLLFNKPIDERRLQMILRQFSKYKPQIQFTDDWADDFGNIPVATYDYRKHFSKIDASFWAWVRTLPGYDPMVLYSITFDPQFLI